MGKTDRNYVSRQVHYDADALKKVFEAVEYLQTTGKNRGKKQKVFNWRTKDGISMTITIHSDGAVHVAIDKTKDS